MRKADLWAAMSANTTEGATITLVNCKTGLPVTGIIQSVQRESGCGSSFNVRLCLPGNIYTTCYVRTVD